MRAAGGDIAAFESLYRRHVASVHRLACWMLAGAETEDIIQDVFVRAWTKLKLFNGRAAFGTWLHKLAVNVILRHRERQEAKSSRLGVLSESPPQGARLSSPGLRMDLEAAIATLPPRARDVFVLHDIEGWKHVEIAEALGISPSTSRAQLHRARMLLRRFLS